MEVRSIHFGMVPVIDLKETGRNIARIRKEAGLSVRDLQMVLGFTSPQAIYKWQHGECLPTLDNIVILSAVLGVRIDEILVIDGGPQTHVSAPATGEARARSHGSHAAHAESGAGCGTAGDAPSGNKRAALRYLA